MFPDLQTAKGNKLNKTKMKYTIQFGIAPYFRDLLKDDLKNIPYSFRFDETTTQQAKKQCDGYTQYQSEKQCIKILYSGTLMVDHCSAEKLLEHFVEFVKANIDFCLLLHTEMNSPNVNLKFEDLL